MFQARVVIIIVLFIICINLSCSNTGEKQGFNAILKNAQVCKHPSPPYVKKFSIVSKYRINILNGTRYLSGNITITAPIKFLNFSGRTFAVDSAGKHAVKFQFSQVSCRNLFAKAIMRFTNITFTAKSCMLHKGFFPYDNMDINKLMHALPSWHAPGDVVHQLQLVSNGATEFCSEFIVTII